MRGSSLASLNLGSQDTAVFISEVKCDPVSGAVLHVNFQKVHQGESITVAVPIRIVGESPIVKSGEGMLLSVFSELEVTCLPCDLPSKVEVDISNLSDIDDAVTVGDLPLDRAKIEIAGLEPRDVVVKVVGAEMAEVTEEVEEVPIDEIEATEEKGKEEGEPAEESSKVPAKEPGV